MCYVLIQRNRLKNYFALFLTKHVYFDDAEAPSPIKALTKDATNSYVVKINFKSMVRKAIVKVWIWS